MAWDERKHQGDSRTLGSGVRDVRLEGVSRLHLKYLLNLRQSFSMSWEIKPTFLGNDLVVHQHRKLSPTSFAKLAWTPSSFLSRSTTRTAMSLRMEFKNI